jgi:RNA polymerase sigma factor (sigma-70 family)
MGGDHEVFGTLRAHFCSRLPTRSSVPATDAEDVLQDSYLRWRDADQEHTKDARAYLMQIVTRQALNHLRTAQRRRENYIGNWLPEPICTEPDASTDAILAESVSMAMLLVLETLNSAERAVFVLSEVFGYTYVEIADMIGKTDVAVRQIAHRAREHVQARRKRFEPDAETNRAVIGRFLVATETGDVESLMEVLAPDVVHISDGGGRVSAARRPIVGAETVARYRIGLARNSMADMDVELATYNALPAVRFRFEGRLDSILMIEVDGARVRALYAVRIPDKLQTATTVHSLTRRKDRAWKP